MAFQITRSLQHRNFRLYFLGQLLSLHGTWMQSVAQAWLVYRLTDSSFMLGLVSFLNLAPVLVFGLVAGAVADRYSRYRLLWITQTLAMLQAFILGALTLSGHIQVEHILLLATTLGIIHAFEIPARHALVAGLVERAELPNAIALNSSLFNLARFLGPALAGILVAAFGEGPVFIINGFSFMTVLIALFAMRPRPAMHARPSNSGGALAGLRFAWRQVPLRYALGLVALISIAGTPYLVLMPVFAREVFSGGAQQLGMLVGGSGLGALAAALRLAQRKYTAGLERVIVVSAVLAGIGLLLFSQAGSFLFALATLPLIGFGITTLVAATNTFLQLEAEDSLRGRLMSLFSMVFLGFAPLGNLLAGYAAQHIGAPRTVTLCALICLLGAAGLGVGLSRSVEGRGK
ncbi:MAG TPA: MFS transporter [Gammaproteobacteria bacterium]|jgi:MFS family permease|nr:MFS transporter [Gammaproteobacteria bacterium]